MYKFRSKTFTKMRISKILLCDNENDTVELRCIVIYEEISCVGVKVINIKFQKGNFTKLLGRKVFYVERLSEVSPNSFL